VDEDGMTSDPNRMWDLAWGIIGLALVIGAIIWLVKRRQKAGLQSTLFARDEALPVLEAKLVPVNGQQTGGCVCCTRKESPLWHFEETIDSSYGRLDWRKRIRANPRETREPITFDAEDHKKRSAWVDSFRNVCPSCTMQRNAAIDRHIEGNHLKRVELEQQIVLGNQAFLESLNENIRREQQKAREAARVARGK
jgi:hypothetical protein